MGSKAREGTKAMSLAFVVLDFQYAGVRKRKEKKRTERDGVWICSRSER